MSSAAPFWNGRGGDLLITWREARAGELGSHGGSVRKKNERRPRQFWKFLGISKSFQYIFGFPVDYIVYLTSNDGINGSIDFSSNRSCWSFLTCFWCSFGAVRSRHRHCDWEIRRLECRWSPTLWPKTWQHTLRRFRHSKSPAFLSEMICHVWPLVWYVLINDDQW